jgi:phage portal protein BeeE
VGGLWDWFTGSQPLAAESIPETRTRFAVDAEDVPAALFGFSSYSDPVAPVGPVKRTVARQVPAIKRARDLICGTLGGIPIQVLDRDNNVSTSSLLDQPEFGVARSITFAHLFEDLLYDGVAWWKRVGNDYRGKPVKVQRLEPSSVSWVDGRAYVNGRQVSDPDRTLIRFDSPNGPLLVDGARAIRTLIRLEASAANQSENPEPAGLFMPKDDADPFEDAEAVRAFLENVKAARQAGSTGYVPASLEYKTNQFNPQQLQLIEARQHAVLEISRITGIAAEDLSVSVGSRTYFNGQQARQDRINDVLGPYMTAVTDRLRMDDITPQGFKVRADYSGFLRADDKTRFENYALLKNLGLITVEQIAELEGLPVPDVAAASPPVITATQVVATPKEIEA